MGMSRRRAVLPGVAARRQLSHGAASPATGFHVSVTAEPDQATPSGGGRPDDVCPAWRMQASSQLQNPRKAYGGFSPGPGTATARELRSCKQRSTAKR